jgi:hypothetical protein
MARSDEEIAVDVADLLWKLDDDDKTIRDQTIAGIVRLWKLLIIAGIMQQLTAVWRVYQGSGDVVKARQLRAHIATARRALRPLKKYRIPALAIVHEADLVLDAISNVTGPDPRSRPFDRVCAFMAYKMILQSPNKRLGDRLRELAGYLYEAATGEPDRDLETACRWVTSHKADFDDIQKNPFADMQLRTKLKYTDEE